MKRSIVLLGLSILALMISPSQADFIQCLPTIICDIGFGVTDFEDFINGTPGQDIIDAEWGNDVVFGGDEADDIEGDDGNDILFGGPGSDVIRGGDGDSVGDDDIILIGPDDHYYSQKIRGRVGNDLAVVFAGDVTTCLFIDMGNGVDKVSLIGFGPYNMNQLNVVPFAETSVHIIDPIGGGHIFIEIDPTGSDDDAEFIFGLPTPDPALIDEDYSMLPDDCPPIVDYSSFF